MAEASAVAEVVARQLEGLLQAGNYDGAKLLLQPVQAVDSAEAIGTLRGELARHGTGDVLLLLAAFLVLGLAAQRF